MTATANGNGRATRPAVRPSGDFATSLAWGDVYAAATHEEAIAAEADAIWADFGATAMNALIFRRLYPLLRRPLHPGHIMATSKGKGKPFDSDGVRSVQVLIDRMNNVLSPVWWRAARRYESDGKLCFVTVRVIDGQGAVLAEGESWGGMDRANTLGNLMKGSFTNAAKLAFAQIGPGHEIYCGAVDYDPDVNPNAAADQAKEPAPHRQSAQAPAVTTAVATTTAAKPDPASAARAAFDEMTPEQHEAEIAKLLAIADDLAGLRKKADDGMQLIGAGPRQRHQKLLDHADRAGLESLLRSVNTILDTQSDIEPAGTEAKPS